MPQILQLPEEVIAKIAAGEVIERPASVLKELLENALDAGAVRISVDIENAGRTLIRVRDDGEGMEPEDLRLSLGRHATSKLRAFEDLDKISTFGFRGEALYSIFAVSKMTVTSCRKGAGSGSAISGEGGRIVSEVSAPPVKGTTVEVRDLFFNTPARAKFLRSGPSERSHLIRTVEEAALANLSAGFTLSVDGAEVFCMPPGGDDFWGALRDRASVVFGTSVYRGLIKTEGRNPAVSVYGLISAPGAMSATRINQHFFVNRRPVASRVMQQALYRGYDAARGDRHPACVLFLDLAPADFDVNTHPQKRDVKFASDNDVFRKISSSVAEAVRRQQSASVSLGGAPAGRDAAPAAAAEPGPAGAAEAAAAEQPLFSGESLRLEPAAGENGEVPGWYQPPITYLGQLSRSYLLFESGGGLLVVDQHAAQERVLFEKYTDELAKAEIRVQPLILPVSVELSRSQIETVMKWKEWLDRAGFETERFGQTTVRLLSTPALFYFTPEGLAEFLGYLAEVLGEPEKVSEDLKRETVATMACKKSVKARDHIKPQEALRLIEDLRAARDSFHCPHGRPTLFHISPSEIARKFHRSGAV